VKREQREQLKQKTATRSDARRGSSEFQPAALLIEPVLVVVAFQLHDLVV
jgi:hypothetical protein